MLDELRPERGAAHVDRLRHTRREENRRDGTRTEHDLRPKRALRRNGKPPSGEFRRGELHDGPGNFTNTVLILGATT
jgi:hypothetical protein